MIGIGKVREESLARLSRFRGDLRQPDGGFDGLNLAEKWTDRAELMLSPMLKESSSFRRHLPVVRIRRVTPLVYLEPEFVDGGSDRVLLILGRDSLSFVQVELPAQKRRIFREKFDLRLEPEHKSPDAKSNLGSYTNPNFQPESEAHKKEQIGGLIADFLSETQIRGKTIFLGSGTPILHVGLKMCEANKPYSQRFVTVNIALAAAFCARDVSPVSKISIPEAVLETQTFRFSTNARTGLAAHRVGRCGGRMLL